MFDIIIRSALDIVGRTERLIEAMRRMLQNDDLDEVEVYELDHEIERLGDVVFNVDEAVRSLARRSNAGRRPLSRTGSVGPCIDG